MFALVCFILAAVVFFLALIHVAVGTVSLITLGLFFIALGFVLDRVPRG